MVKKFGLGKGLDALIPVSDNSIKKKNRLMTKKYYIRFRYKNGTGK